MGDVGASTEVDRASVELLYAQAKHDVVESRYPCTESDCFTLAALQAQEEFGETCPADHSHMPFYHIIIHNILNG